MKQIGFGAEAKLYQEGETVTKERVPKNYRIPEIDKALRTTRTRREAKVLERLHSLGLPVPKVESVDDKKAVLKMSFLNGEKLRDVISKNAEKLGNEIGILVGKMHNCGMIHGDLTTSNMILCNGKVHLIDFGLSFFSEKAEDKAVDLHVLEEALSSTMDECESCVKAVIEGYSETAKDAKEVLLRLEKVRTRGRNKKK